MRVTPAVLHRITLGAGLACAVLLSGCTTRNSLYESTAAATAPSAIEADAAKAAAEANAGAQTRKVSDLRRFLWFFSPYRPDIQQGNFVSQEMLSQLKVGMTREQVQFVLGTPLLTDMFHADRWDYPFRLERGNGELTTSRVTVFFKDGKVEKFDGGNLPTEKEYIARIAGPSKIAKDGPPKDKEQPQIQIQK
jgi:outer membrane protein assembly factor BamE